MDIHLLCCFGATRFFAFRQSPTTLRIVRIVCDGCHRCGYCLRWQQGRRRVHRCAGHLIRCWRWILGIRLSQQIWCRYLWITRMQNICKTTASKWSVWRVTGHNYRRCTYTTRIEYRWYLIIARHSDDFMFMLHDQPLEGWKKSNKRPRALATR